MFTIIVISDEDYVDALLLSQQNAASSSLLDLAIVEVKADGDGDVDGTATEPPLTESFRGWGF